MKTIETINTLCQNDASLYRAHRDELLANIKTLDECVSVARDNNESVRSAVKSFIAKVGEFAAKVTVASLINRSAWDGRISTANAKWAKAVEESWDEDAMVRMGAYCKMHMAHLDQTADYVRRNLDEITAEIEAEQKAKQETEQAEAIPVWSVSEHDRMERRGQYDYRQAILEDVITYIQDEVNASEYEDRDSLEEYLNDTLWTEDSVTGNGSGSYTFDRAKAREYVVANLDLVQEMAGDFCIDTADLGEHFMQDDWEWFDVSIRCNLLGWAIGYALDWLESDDRRKPLRYGVGVDVAF